jgi:hypothetical protein
VILVSRIMLIDILEKFDLIKALIKEILVVLYNFNTNIDTCVQIMSLYSFTKCSRSQILGDMIAASYYRI